MAQANSSKQLGLAPRLATATREFARACQAKEKAPAVVGAD